MVLSVLRCGSLQRASSLPHPLLCVWGLAVEAATAVTDGGMAQEAMVERERRQQLLERWAEAQALARGHAPPPPLGMIPGRTSVIHRP